MHLRAILFASLFVLGSFTTACVGGESADGGDEPQAQNVEVSVQDGTLSAKDTKTTTTTTPTPKERCADTKVKSACKQAEEFRDYLHQ